MQLLGKQPLVRRLATFQPSVICLCQGGTTDFLLEPDLMTWIRQVRIPYIIICQANDEEARPSDEDYLAGREVLTAAKAVIFVSKHNHLLANRQFNLVLGNAFEVQNPPPKRTWPQFSWPSAPPYKLATVSRLECGAKGLDMLIPALKDALGNGTAWELDIYGRGPDKARLQALVKACNLEEQIRFRGHSDDVTNVWSDHHLMLLPSRFEGCSLAMMEASLCGRPVLATPVGGVDEWMVDGETGFIASGINQSAVAEALQRAWAARHDWAELGRRATQRANRMLAPDPGRALLEIITRNLIA